MTVILNITVTQEMRGDIDLQVKDANYVGASDDIRALIRADSRRQLDRLAPEGLHAADARGVHGGSLERA
jgi:Arc/MetJ-type ribon-helix-helix transcriptional regulator